MQKKHLNTALKHLLFALILFCLVIPALSHAQHTSDEAAIFSTAEKLINNQHYRKALQLLDSLINSDDPQTQIKALRLSAQIHLADGDTDLAIEKLNETLTLSRTIFNRHEEAQSLYHLARAVSHNNSFDLAKQYAEEAALLAQHLRNEKLEYQIRNFLIYTYFMTETDFYKTLSQEAQLFHLVNSVGSELQKALVYNNLGYNLTVAGTVPIDSTISLMKFANETYAKLEGHEGRWYTLMNLTWQHRLSYDLETSKLYGEKSMAQALTEEDRHAILEAAFHLGETMMEMGQIEEARSHYETGLKWRRDEQDRDRHVFDVYYAKFLWETGQKGEAVSLLEEAVEWLVNSEVFYEMHGRTLLASYYFENGDIKRAEEQLAILDNPRHNYISLESRCISAITKAQILFHNGRRNVAEASMRSWLDHTKHTGMEQLSLLIEKKFPNL